MGLSANFYKSDKCRIVGWDELDDKQSIAYFRNNWDLHRKICRLGDGPVLLNEEALCDLLIDAAFDVKYNSVREAKLNKDFGEGESVITGVIKSLKVVRDEGCFVYYLGKY